MTGLTSIFRGNKYIFWELNKKCTESREIQKSKCEVFSETPFTCTYTYLLVFVDIKNWDGMDIVVWRGTPWVV